ncbi:MAG: hypothetical protein ABR953_06725 [Candidatus Acidiferrales bacterium]|jgi:hypothetical protein
MFLGHFGVAFTAKKAAPKTSLGTLVLAAQLADMLWPIFLLLGWEKVRIAPGITRVTPLDFVSYLWSHSLVAQIGWAILLGAAYFAIRRDGRGAAVVGACVPTHWLLDYIAHRPDMPLVPGGTGYGLGMWNSLPLTLAAELALFGFGLLVYLSGQRAIDRTGQFALWSLVIVLVVIYFASTFGPPPPNVLALSALAIWLTVPWAAWADRHRMPRANAGRTVT